MTGRIEFKLSLEKEDFTPNDVIVGFKAARAVPVEKIMEDLVSGREELTFLFFNRHLFSTAENIAIGEWINSYFQKKLSEDKITEQILTTLLPREITLKGMSYLFGWGVKEDHRTAFYLFNTAADQNDSLAQFYVGRCYERGNGIAKDVEAARTYYEKANARGSIAAHNNLEALNEQPNLSRALLHYQQKIEQECAAELCSLGAVYQKQSSQNLDQAKQLFAAASVKGLPSAIYHYELCMPQEQRWKFMCLAVLWHETRNFKKTN